MNVVYGRRIIKYIYEFSDEETLKTWMEEFEAKIRTSNTKESVIRQIESIEAPELDKKLMGEYLSLLEDK
jgi:hypothetical protein